MMEHERWDRVFSATCVGVPWQLRPDQRNLVRPVVPEAEAEQDIAPVIVMPAVPKTDRRRYVTERDLVNYGYTDECRACTQFVSGMYNTKVPHDDRCRNRIGELMASDDDQRQIQRVTSRAAVEVESRVRKPDMRCTLVNRWIVWLDRKHSHDRWKGRVQVHPKPLSSQTCKFHPKPLSSQKRF